MNKFKIILSIFFLLLGIVGSIIIYNLSDKDSLGVIPLKNPLKNPLGSKQKMSVGIDSSNDGVAIGLGIISGFSFLSSVLLLNSIKNTKE